MEVLHQKLYVIKIIKINIIKMKIVIRILLFILFIIIVSNFIPHVAIGERFLFTTGNQEFVGECMPSKGRTVELMEAGFRYEKKHNPEFKNLVLYRTFKKEFWKFWNWRRYLTNPLYKYPYLDISSKEKSINKKDKKD